MHHIVIHWTTGGAPDVGAEAPCTWVSDRICRSVVPDIEENYSGMDSAACPVHVDTWFSLREIMGGGTLLLRA